MLKKFCFRTCMESLATLTFYSSKSCIKVTKKKQNEKDGVNLILSSLFYTCSLCFKLSESHQGRNVLDDILNQTPDCLSKTLTPLEAFLPSKEYIFLGIFKIKIQIAPSQSTSGRLFSKFLLHFLLLLDFFFTLLYCLFN